MAPGGLSNFCDDCGYQACLKANCCLQAHGEALLVDPQELVLAGLVYAGVDLTAEPDGPALFLGELSDLDRRVLMDGIGRIQARTLMVEPLQRNPAETFRLIRSEGVRRE